MNPALPLQHFVPDAEARVWQDGRLYVYGSCDISGNTRYCSKRYRVYSTSDLVSWTDHGVSFSTTTLPPDSPWFDQILYAPDCIYKDGKYHLYFCTAANGEGVATSENPWGPFGDPQPVAGADRDAIDPAVLVDDDGSVYYFWGQFHLRAARLNSLLNAIEPATLQTSLLNEKEHGFHEGASIRKHNGTYYLVYTDISRGRATCLAYATSLYPLGPYTKRGIIIDNSGCDPETWNNHGSIHPFNGRWYVFYHRSSQASRYSRRLCIEPITINADGSINEVEMTSQGAGPAFVAGQTIEAARACMLSGKVRILPIETATDEQTTEVLSRIENGDTACYRYVDFSAGMTRLEIYAASATGGGEIELRLDHPKGRRIGCCTIGQTSGWRHFEAFPVAIEPVVGRHALWLIFKGVGGRLMDLQSITLGSTLP